MRENGFDSSLTAPARRWLAGLLLSCCCLLAVAGCGQKGGLYLPEDMAAEAPTGIDDEEDLEPVR